MPTKPILGKERKGTGGGKTKKRKRGKEEEMIYPTFARSER